VIVPSIDIQGGSTVQLIGGEQKALDAGDPLLVAERFARAGEIAVIDLDAAMGKGDNEAQIRALVERFPCRVGGGIRDLARAKRWLDHGAAKIILGTAARPELLKELPRERLIAAVDARNGEVVVNGWTTNTGLALLDQVRLLAPYVGGFLVTFVEREGRLGGTALERVPAILEAAGDARVTIAGGVSTAEEIAALDRLGADAQVGMAIYTGRLAMADAVAAPLTSDRPDGLWPTVVVDVHGVALGLCWSNRESLAVALDRGVGAYHSRRRGLWVKGETSGATQRLVRVDLDCDRDALRFTVEQTAPGFCHEDTWTCWGPGRGLPRLARELAARRDEPAEGSYTRRLLGDPALLRAKLHEEAEELLAAESPEHAAEEAADLLYFAMVAMTRGGADLAAVERALDRRALRTTRRPGDAKPGALPPTGVPPVEPPPSEGR